MNTTKPDIVMHKLKGKHDYEDVGDRLICRVCKSEKEKPLNLHTFTSGSTINATDMNDNFQQLANTLRKLGDRLSSINDKLDALIDIKESYEPK